MFTGMNTAMTRITVSVPTDMAARLDAEARATDRSASAIVRLALRAALPESSQGPGYMNHYAPAAARQRALEGERAADAARQSEETDRQTSEALNRLFEGNNDD